MAASCCCCPTRRQAKLLQLASRAQQTLMEVAQKTDDVMKMTEEPTAGSPRAPQEARSPPWEQTMGRFLARSQRGCCGRVYAVVTSVLFNTTDPMFWVKRGCIALIQTVLLIYSLVLNWDNLVPRDMMLIAITMMLFEPVRITYNLKRVLNSHRELRQAFVVCDVDKDGVLNQMEAAHFLKDFPEFTLRHNRNDQYTMDDVVTLLKHRNKDLRGPLFEFCISWLCFFAGLMLHLESKSTLDAVLSVLLGIIGILDLCHIMHRFWLRYLSQYATHYWGLRLYNRILYYSLILGITATLLSGFSIVTALDAKGYSLPGTDLLPQSDALGFFFGWLLTLAIFWISLIIWCHFRIFYMLGCIKWRATLEENRKSQWEANPHYLLGVHNPQFAV